MKIHGNYCGPGWSGGKYQNSVYGSEVPPLDELDALCQKHDEAYALAVNNAAIDLEKADRDLATAARNHGVVGELIHTAISYQAVARRYGVLGNKSPVIAQKSG